MGPQAPSLPADGACAHALHEAAVKSSARRVPRTAGLSRAPQGGGLFADFKDACMSQASNSASRGDCDPPRGLGSLGHLQRLSSGCAKSLADPFKEPVYVPGAPAFAAATQGQAPGPLSSESLSHWSSCVPHDCNKEVTPDLLKVS